MNKSFVFVYGTLRKHEVNHGHLVSAKLISEQAWTFGDLFDTGKGYPMLKPSQTGKVYGEIYEIDEKTLAILDDLEDYQPGRADNLYERIVQTIYTDTEEIKAFVYISDRTNIIPISYRDWKVYQLMNKKPNKVYYFAYGSCMDKERFQRAAVDHYFEEVIGAAVLQNYSMKYTFKAHDGGRADIVEDGGVTEGILYEIPFEAVEYLFNREGYFSGWYRATFVDVSVKEITFHNVLTFHVYEKQQELPPPEHYAVEILRGSKSRVSDEYFDRLVKQLNDFNVPYSLNHWK